jgi:hypothetical protein
MSSASHSRDATALKARLQARRPELEAAILTRVYGIADPAGIAEQQYVDGLRKAVSAAVGYGLAVIEPGPRRGAPPIPPQLLVQARLAARNGVSLDTVLRRYLSGNTIFADALIEEAKGIALRQSELQRLYRAQASIFEHLLAAIGEEYAREDRAGSKGNEEHRVQLVERLLAGELLDSSELDYNFDFWHLGILATGPSADKAVRFLAESLDRALLFVTRSNDLIWAWLGGRRPFEADERRESLNLVTSAHASLAVGEPAEGLPGWRLTHRQATAALPIALRGSARVARYAQAPLLAAALQDELLATSLRQLYLDPLRGERDGGAVAMNTLRAYFAASGNASSAAAALGISRRTVGSRLAAIEDRLDLRLDAASAEIETALRLDEIEGHTGPDTQSAR